MTKATEEEPSAPDGAAPGVDLAEAVEQVLLGQCHVDASGPSEEALRDGYKEARADARAFIDLRFKHFTTFAVVFGIASLAASREELQAVRPGIAAAMVAVTLLFWSIDGRTSQYHRGVLLRIGGYEEALHLPRPAPTPGRRRLPSSAATSLLFLLAVCVWLTVLGVHLFGADQHDQTGGNAPETQPQVAGPLVYLGGRPNR